MKEDVAILKELTDRQSEKLKIYAEELLRFNKKFSLYSRKKPKSFIWELILDSLQAGKILLKDSSQECIADIGSGAGFPGVILSLLDPKRRFILYEPHQKKSEFLHYVTWKMGIKNVEIKAIPVQKTKEKLVCATSKAFFSLNKRLLLTAPVFKKGGIYYHFQPSPVQPSPGKAFWQPPLELRKIWKMEGIKTYTCQGQKRALFKTLRI